MAGLSAFLKTPLGRKLVRLALKWGLSYLRMQYKKLMRYLAAREALKKYKEVINDGGKTDAEEIEATEDFLNNRKPRP